MMRLLLDTNAWLWQMREPRRLNERARELLADAANELLLSAASVCEAAGKSARSRGRMWPRPFPDIVADEVAAGRVLALPITHAHAARTSLLPLHHRDPFDRLLIAQAQIEGVPVLTSDPMFERYQVQVIRADR